MSRPWSYVGYGSPNWLVLKEKNMMVKAPTQMIISQITEFSTPDGLKFSNLQKASRHVAEVYLREYLVYTMSKFGCSEQTINDAYRALMSDPTKFRAMLDDILQND